MMAVVVGVSGDTMTITGTNGNDDVVITWNDRQHTLNVTDHGGVVFSVTIGKTC